MIKKLREEEKKEEVKKEVEKKITEKETKRTLKEQKEYENAPDRGKNKKVSKQEIN